MSGATPGLASDPRLSRVVALINGKGGVGKSSITANVAGQLARSGYRVLVVDLDLGGNLGLDLGYAQRELGDHGRGTVEAVANDGELPRLTRVRDGLDAVPGGRLLEHLQALDYARTVDVPTRFAERLADVAGDYDVVLLDCAPGNPVLQRTALRSAAYVVIPTRTDPAGWDGLRMVHPMVEHERAANPALTYLGVVIFAHQTVARSVLARTRAALTSDVGDIVALFDTTIRYSEASAYDCRQRGQLAHELARDAIEATRERLELLRSRKRDGSVTLPPALSGSATTLAQDYAALAREFLTRIAQHESRSSAGGTLMEEAR